MSWLECGTFTVAGVTNYPKKFTFALVYLTIKLKGVKKCAVVEMPVDFMGYFLQ